MACRRIVPLLLLGVVNPLRLAAQCPDGSPPPCRALATARPAAPAPNSVAVLYFDNLSPDPADAYLADGLTDEIIPRLGQIERLVVKSRTAVGRYRGRAADPPTLGRALGVAHLVNGTVRRGGQRLRVTVELVRAASGDRVWGERFDRAKADLLDIQEEIARAVATAIAGRLLPTERQLLVGRPTRDPQAYDRFLKGTYYLDQRTPYALTRAIGEYEAATHLDATFVGALGRMAHAYALLLNWQWEYPGVPPDSLLVRGLAATDRALASDSSDSDVWMARGTLLSHLHPRTFEGVRAAFTRAIALDPRNAEALNVYGHLLAVLGDDSASVAALERALAVEPERAVSMALLGYREIEHRRYRDARWWLDSAVAVDPGAFYAHALRSYVRLRLGQTVEALRDAQTALSSGPSEYVVGPAAVALAELAAGDTLAARARLDRVLSTGGTRRATVWELWFLGGALVAAGWPERALDYLGRARPDIRRWSVLRYPEFDGLRTHPGFQRLAEEARPPGAPR